VYFQEQVDRRFELFNLLERHSCVHRLNFMFEFSFKPTPCQAKLLAGSRVKNRDN
jgi:hypothetical protein